MQCAHARADEPAIVVQHKVQRELRDEVPHERVAARVGRYERLLEAGQELGRDAAADVETARRQQAQRSLPQLGTWVTYVVDRAEYINFTFS